VIARSSALLLFITTLEEREDKENLFMKTKKQTFNGSELAMLFQAFAKKLFIHKKGIYSLFLPIRLIMIVISISD